MEKLKRLSQYIGEFICFIPMLIIAYLFNIIWTCIFAIIIFTIYKQFVKGGLHFNKSKYCIALTYFLFICVGLICKNFCNQPLITTYLISFILFSTSQIGIYKGIYDKVTSFNLENCSKNELKEVCKLHNIKAKHYKVLYYKYIKCYTINKISIELDMLPDTIEKIIKRSKIKLKQ